MNSRSIGYQGKARSAQGDEDDFNDILTHLHRPHRGGDAAAMGAAVMAAGFGAYTLEMLMRAFSTDNEDLKTEAAREARDQEYRTQFAARIFALSGGMCWPR